MKTFMTSGFLAMLFLTIAVGCKQDDDNTGLTKTDYLTTGIWRPSSTRVVRYMNRDTVIDLTVLQQACVQDNRITFGTNHIETVDEGATKCNSVDPQQKLYTWSFQNGETRLHAVNNVNPSDTVSGAIQQLDDANLKIRIDGSVNSIPVSTELGFVH